MRAIHSTHTLFGKHPGIRVHRHNLSSFWILGICVCLLPSAAPGQWPRQGGPSRVGGAGLSIVLMQPEAEVIKAVQSVVDDHVIHGTWVYERDRTLTGAHSEQVSKILHGTEGSDKAFYKVADQVVAPRFFVGSADVGEITVRYLVQGVGKASTRLQIDAVFNEYGHKQAHRSTGAVELAEYQAIELELKNIHAAQVQPVQAREQSSSVDHTPDSAPSLTPLPALSPTPQPTVKPPSAQDTSSPATATSAVDESNQLLHRIADLKRKVEMRIKASDVPLKSSPFRASATLGSVSAHAEVLILIVTPHWYGIETRTGQHGWVPGSQLEPLP